MALFSSLPFHKFKFESFNLLHRKGSFTQKNTRICDGDNARLVITISFHTWIYPKLTIE